MIRVPRSRACALPSGLVCVGLLVACGGGSGQHAAKPANTVIQNKGSDTMVNVAQVWAEEYRKVAPDVEVKVSGYFCSFWTGDHPIMLSKITDFFKLKVYNGSAWRNLRLDRVTDALESIDYAHHEIHGGSSLFVCYSVADLGGMTTPNDMIQLSFATPNTTKELHMMFLAKSGGAALFTLTEAPTGGLSTPTGTLSAINCNRNSATTSVILGCFWRYCWTS